MKKILYILAFFGLIGRGEAKLLEMEHFVLPNGLNVAVVENHKAPVVLQMLYYKSGSADDPKGKGGIAHLLEHLMFRGTADVPGQGFNKLTEEHGADNNAYTTIDHTAYYEFSDITKLELMMALEADRMQGLQIDDEAFLKERDIVLEERMQRFESSTAPLFYETVRQILWQDSPYANPVSGSVSEIKALEKADAEAFYRLYYRPDNALLVLGGDITLDEAKALAEKYYGGLKAEGEMPKREVYIGKPAKTEFKMALEGIIQPRYQMQIRLAADTFSKKEIMALELLAEYLAGDDTAYLYDKLVYGKKLLLSVSSDVSYDAKVGGVFGISAVPVKEMAPAALKAEIEKTASQGVAAFQEAKLQKIKNEMLSSAVYLTEDPTDTAKFVGGMLISGYTSEEIMHYDEALQAVSVQDIKEAWKKVLAMPIRVDAYLTGTDKGEAK